MRRLGVIAVVHLLPFTLAAQEVARVEVAPAHASVVAGQDAQFHVTALDAAGRPVTGGTTIWIATPFDIAGSDSTGRVTTFRPGRVYVIALVEGKPGFGVLDIAERELARLRVRAPSGTATVVGDVLRLEAAGETEIGDPLPPVPARWSSSDPAVARAGPGGLVVARSPGRARIRAQAEGHSAEIEVEVRPNPVSAISVGPVPERVRTGDVVRLSAVLRDADGRPVSDVPLRWAVTGDGAAIDADGAFVAEEPGSYPVTASVGAVSAATALRVVARNDPRRVESVAHVPLPGDVQAAELWPIGDALYVSSIAGVVYVFDISDPAAPALTDSLTVDARLINDVSTSADGRIGVLSREGASTRKNGLVFFDASDPLHPTVISEFSDPVSGGVHSAFVYEHYVFATDDATGSLRIVDFADPRVPRQVARWEIPREATAFPVAFLNIAPQRYLHDVYVEDGLAYLAYWRDGLVILDVGNGVRGGSITDPKLVSQFQYAHAELYPPGYIAGTHTVFRSGDYVFVGDESYSGTVDLFSRERFATRGLLHVIDVSDIENPKKVAGWDPIEFGAHNLWVEDDVLYIGAYDGGLRVFDVSGELRGDLGRQGRQIGSLYTGSLEGFRPNMALTWGAIPHDGYIFASDINTGLWVARVRGAPVP